VLKTSFRSFVSPLKKGRDSEREDAGSKLKLLCTLLFRERDRIVRPDGVCFLLLCPCEKSSSERVFAGSESR